MNRSEGAGEGGSAPGRVPCDGRDGLAARDSRDDLAARDPRDVYAALDLGTNNCRLLMATPAANGFRVIEAYSAVTRLGEGLGASGMLCEAAMGRTIEALRHCGRRIERRRARRRRAVATEACRRAANCDTFLARTAAETGLVLEIISPAEEAALTLAGCASLLDADPPDALIFDIGGGSTELIHARRDPHSGQSTVASMESEPVGVVTLAEEAGERLADPAYYAAVVAGMTERLRRFEAGAHLTALAAANRLQLVGTSGTVTTLAGVHLGLARYDRRAVDGLDLDLAAVTEASRRVVGAGPAERSGLPCVGRDRADLLVAGCAILDAILALWPARRLRVADRGLREGLLLTMMGA